MSIVANIINLLAEALILLVIIHVILSYILDLYHPLRQFVDRIVEPMLQPIRRIVPHIGMLDFSPLILIVLIRLVANLLIKLF